MKRILMLLFSVVVILVQFPPSLAFAETAEVETVDVICGTTETLCFEYEDDSNIDISYTYDSGLDISIYMFTEAVSYTTNELRLYIVPHGASSGNLYIKNYSNGDILKTYRINVYPAHEEFYICKGGYVWTDLILTDQGDSDKITHTSPDGLSIKLRDTDYETQQIEAGDPQSWDIMHLSYSVKGDELGDYTVGFYWFEEEYLTADYHVVDHDYIVSSSVSPTCTESGIIKKTCTRCGEQIVEEIPAQGHKWNTEYSVDTEPSCTESGSQSIHCTICDAVKDDSFREIPALGHSWSEAPVVVGPSCTEDGSQSVRCIVCDAVKDDSLSVIPSLGHTWNTEYMVDVQPTCTDDGYESIHCSVCGVIQEGSSRTIPARHTWTEFIDIEPTCTNEGSIKKVCTECGETTTETINATGHSYALSKWIWSKDYNSATALFVCQNDGAHAETKDAVITSKTTNPTCIADGKTVYTASVEFEGKTYTDAKESAIAASHQPGTTVEENRKNPTCETTGSYDIVVYCTVCGEELSRTTQEIPAKGHDYTLSGWAWSDDFSSASAAFICKNNAAHETVIDAVISSKVVETQTIRTTKYTAKVIHNGITYTETESAAELLLPGLISLASATIVVPDQTYSGKLVEPLAEVSLNGTVLHSGEDYSIFYSNNLDAGTAKVTIIGEGDYTGKASRSFTIMPKEVVPTVTLAASTYTFDGKEKKPFATVKVEDVKLPSSDYSVEYGADTKNVGGHSVTVTLSGNYSGTTTVNYKINPKGTTLATSTAASKAITVKWKKQSTKMASSRITGYQIQLATDSKFTKNKKTVTVSGYSKTSKRISGLKGKKKYYIRIRTYKTVSGTKYYSPWSKAKTITTKS